MNTNLCQNAYRQELFLYFNELRANDSWDRSPMNRYLGALLEVVSELPSPEKEERFVEGILGLQAVEEHRRAA